MHKELFMLHRTVVVVMGLLLLGTYLAAAPVKPAPKPEKKEVAGVKATLVKVDADKKVLSVKLADGKVKDIQVTQDTRFIGPRGGVSDQGIKDDRLTAGAELKLVLSADGKSAKEVHLPFRKSSPKKEPVKKETKK